MKNLVLSLGVLAATVSICLTGPSALVFGPADGATPSLAQTEAPAGAMATPNTEVSG